jgi:hypothetical protein
MPSIRDELALIRENMAHLQADMRVVIERTDEDRSVLRGNVSAARTNNENIASVSAHLEAMWARIDEQRGELAQILELLRTVQTLRRWFLGSVALIVMVIGGVYHFWSMAKGVAES